MSAIQVKGLQRRGKKKQEPKLRKIKGIRRSIARKRGERGLPSFKVFRNAVKEGEGRLLQVSSQRPERKGKF